MNLLEKNNKKVILFAYYEKNQQYKDNLLFFLKFGYYNDNDIDYIIIINGTHTLSLPKYDNLYVLERENRGFDFGGWAAGLKTLKKKYDYYIFLNASIRGPFIPTYINIKWYEPFINLIKSDIKLVGSTIAIVEGDYIWNPLPGKFCSVVQTYIFAMDFECLEFLMKCGFFDKEYENILSVGKYQECGMSILVLQNGWNISCLIPEYQNRDYRKITKNFNPYTSFGEIVLLNPDKACFGRTIHPYEVIFIKTNRGFFDNIIASLTNNRLR